MEIELAIENKTLFEKTIHVFDDVISIIIPEEKFWNGKRKFFNRIMFCDNKTLIYAQVFNQIGLKIKSLNFGFLTQHTEEIRVFDENEIFEDLYDISCDLSPISFVNEVIGDMVLEREHQKKNKFMQLHCDLPERKHPLREIFFKKFILSSHKFLNTFRELESHKQINSKDGSKLNELIDFSSEENDNLLANFNFYKRNKYIKE